ncbi:20833_t:CDS:1, partial [Racocetra persica]
SGISGFIKFDTFYENKLNPNSFGAFVQSFIPQGFLNQQVKLTCYVKYA